MISGETKQLPQITITWTNNNWFYSKIYVLVNTFEDSGKLVYSGEWSITGGKRGAGTPNQPITILETELLPDINPTDYGFQSLTYPSGNYSIVINGKANGLGSPPFSDTIKYMVMVDCIMGQMSSIDCNGVTTNFDALP